MSGMPLQSLQGPGVGEEEFDLSQMSEEEIQQLISLGVIDENMAENARQMATQEALRYGAAPEGRDSGRVYTAANPLEHIGAGLQQYNAAKKMKELEAQRGAMGKEQTAARGTWYDALRGYRKKKLSPEDILGGMQMPTLE